MISATVPTFNVSSWGEVAMLIGIIATLSTIFGTIIAARLNTKKSNIEQAAADDQASDRLIKLIETEAQKKVEIVRTEFKLEIAELKLAHATELGSIRDHFENQLRSLREEHDTYRCEHALTCSWRFKAFPPPPSLPVV